MQHTKPRMCCSLHLSAHSLASRERVAIQYPFLSHLLSGKMAVEGKGALPALTHAHAAWQTQILGPSPKTWCWVLCVQTGLMWRCPLLWDQLLQHDGNML